MKIKKNWKKWYRKEIFYIRNYLSMRICLQILYKNNWGQLQLLMSSLIKYINFIHKLQDKSFNCRKKEKNQSSLKKIILKVKMHFKTLKRMSMKFYKRKLDKWNGRINYYFKDFNLLINKKLMLKRTNKVK